MCHMEALLLFCFFVSVSQILSFSFRVTKNAKYNKNTEVWSQWHRSDTHTRRINLTNRLKFLARVHFTNRFSLHPETVFWLCKTMGEIQAPQKSHKTGELVSRHCFFPLFRFQVCPEFCVWFPSPDTSVVAMGFQFQGVGGEKKKLNTVQKNIATCNQICHMTFSSPELKGHSVSHTDRKALTCTRTDADTKCAPVVSACVHGNTQPRRLSACLPERRSPFSADNPSLFPPVS